MATNPAPRCVPVRGMRRCFGDCLCGDAGRHGGDTMIIGSGRPDIMGGFATTCPRCGQEYIRGGRIGNHYYTAPEDCACLVTEDVIARLERGIIAERDRLKARHRELMQLADRAERRRKASHEGSQLIAMARELEPTIAALTALAGDGGGL
jgi:hypothetical protein